MTITTGLSLLPYLLYHTTPIDFCFSLENALDTEKHCVDAANCSSSVMPNFARIDSRSVGVTGEGLYFPINSSLALFASIGFILAMHSFCLVYMSITREEKLKNVGKGDNYHMYIMEHQFTSPDAPVKVADDAIPQR